VRFALTRPDASIDEVRALDAALTSVMAEIKTSPPPDQPVYLTAAYEPSAVAGVPFSVRLSLHADVPQAFLVAATCELIVGDWKSGPSVRQVNQAIGGTPIDAEFVFTIPADVSGAGEVRASAAYRLNPTGEGQDLRASPKTPLPPLAVVRR
jgi:hypothetical protein